MTAPSPDTTQTDDASLHCDRAVRDLGQSKQEKRPLKLQQSFGCLAQN